jgi:hypothetical protein
MNKTKLEAMMGFVDWDKLKVEEAIDLFLDLLSNEREREGKYLKRSYAYMKTRGGKDAPLWGIVPERPSNRSFYVLNANCWLELPECLPLKRTIEAHDARVARHEP